MHTGALLICCTCLVLVRADAQQLLVQGRVDAASQEGELAGAPVTLSWAGTSVSTAFENVTSMELRLEALPASAARLNYNRFRAELDGEEVGEFGTTPGRQARGLLGPAYWIWAYGCTWVHFLMDAGYNGEIDSFSNCREQTGVTWSYEDISPGPHTFTLVKLTEGRYGCAVLNNISLPDGGR